MQSLYQTDFFSWTEEQIRVLQDMSRRHPDLGLDYANLIEEIEDLGRSQPRALGSALGEILEHLAKLLLSPAPWPRRQWRISVTKQRQKVEKLLEDSPSLRARVPDLTERAWRDARMVVSLTLEGDGVRAEAIPTANPFAPDQILDETFWPENRFGLTD